jgi:hypothetical protein
MKVVKVRFIAGVLHRSSRSWEKSTVVNPVDGRL